MDKNVVTQIMILFLMMIVGYISRKREVLNSDLNKGLTKILLHIAAPFLVVSSFQFVFSRKLLADAVVVLIFAVIMHLLVILLGKLLFNGTFGDAAKVLQFGALFSNCGWVGYPIVGSIFGHHGIFLMSIYNAVQVVFLWTYGVFIFTGKIQRHSLVNVFKNPGIIALTIGMVLFIFSIKIPLPIAKTLEIIGSTTIPISMLVIGSTLAEVKPGELFSSWLLYYGTFIRLLLIPIVTLIFLKWLNFHKVLLEVCVLTQAMPAAAMVVPLSEYHNGNVIFASKIVVLSTILSVFTIPFIMGLFHS